MVDLLVPVLLACLEEVAADGLLDKLKTCRLAESYADRLGCAQKSLRRERRESIFSFD